MTENATAKEIVDAAFRIHTTLGPGLLESVYDAVLAYELGRRGLRVVRQQPIPIVYEDIRIDTGFRADLIVEDKVIIEVKSVENLAPVHKKQLLTYLPARRQAPWLAHQLSRATHQRWHHARRQWTRRRSSRKVAKPPRHAA
jgi:GxxExxY protein